MPQNAPRKRRSAAEARRLILEAAEKRLREGGPEAIRLQEIAADVGISHPAILHHFGSRDGLVRELEEHAVAQLNGELTTLLAQAREGGDFDAHEFIARAAATLDERGYGKLLAWTLLSHQRASAEAPATLLRGLAEQAHEVRRRAHRKEGKRTPPFEDTLFTMLAGALALFGDAICGPFLRGSAGLVPDDLGGASRFHDWLSDLLLDHLSPSALP